jgi:hypothetical protein
MSVNIVNTSSQFIDVMHEDNAYIQALIDGGAFVSEVSEEGKRGGLLA